MEERLGQRLLTKATCMILAIAALIGGSAGQDAPVQVGGYSILITSSDKFPLHRKTRPGRVFVLWHNTANDNHISQAICTIRARKAQFTTDGVFNQNYPFWLQDGQALDPSEFKTTQRSWEEGADRIYESRFDWSTRYTLEGSHGIFTCGVTQHRLMFKVKIIQYFRGPERMETRAQLAQPPWLPEPWWYIEGLSPLRLSCTVLGESPVIMSWWRGSERLSLGYTRSLDYRLPAFSPKEAARYTCGAQDFFGSTSSSLLPSQFDRPPRVNMNATASSSTQAIVVFQPLGRPRLDYVILYSAPACKQPRQCPCQGECSLSGSVTPSVDEDDQAGPQRVVLSGLRPNTQYDIAVAANSQLRGGFPSAVNVYTHEAPPSEPLNFRTESENITSIRLSWNPPALPRGTVIEYILTYMMITPSGSGRQLMKVDGLVGQLEVGDLAEGTTYSFSLSAVNRAGQGAAAAITVSTMMNMSEPTSAAPATPAVMAQSDKTRGLHIGAGVAIGIGLIFGIMAVVVLGVVLHEKFKTQKSWNVPQHPLRRMPTDISMLSELSTSTHPSQSS
eukprot:scpid66450/ scgid28440/ Protein sidekick-1